MSKENAIDVEAKVEDASELKHFAVDFTAVFTERETLGVCRCIIDAKDVQEAMQQFVKLTNTDLHVMAIVLAPSDEEWKEQEAELKKQLGDRELKKPESTPVLVNLKSANSIFIKKVSETTK